MTNLLGCAWKLWGHTVNHLPCEGREWEGLGLLEGPGPEEGC